VIVLPIAAATPGCVLRAQSATTLEQWHRAHELLVADAAAAAKSASLVLVGDSIFEKLRGSVMGTRFTFLFCPVDTLAALGAARGFRAPLALAIAGDMTQHILWRLQNGELPAQMRARRDVTYGLLAGTNNLAYGHSPTESARGVGAIARELLRTTRGSVAVSLILARAGSRRSLKRICPPRCAPNGRPFVEWDALLAPANDAIVAEVTRLRAEFPRRIAVADCGEALLIRRASTPDAAGARAPAAVLNRSLVPDGTHPNCGGYKRWLPCFLGALRSLADEPSVGGSAGAAFGPGRS